MNIEETGTKLGLSLDADTVHLWRIQLEEPGDVTTLWSKLSSDEHARASRFRFSRLQKRFIVAHARLREILSCYVGIPAAALRFIYGGNGKPILAFSGNGQSLHFNLSHSEDQALIAIAREHEVGVDIEFIRPDLATHDIARSFFSSIERHTLSELNDEQRTTGFFKCWTCKEAYIKGLGKGMEIPLDGFDVCAIPQAPARLLRPYGNSSYARAWQLYKLEVGKDFAAALAVQGAGVRLKTVNF